MNASVAVKELGAKAARTIAILPSATTIGLGAEMTRREGTVARHPGLRTRRVQIAATIALGLAILSSGTAAAFSGALGERGTVVVRSKNTTTHQMSAMAYITSETYAQRNTIPQDVAVKWWLCSAEVNKCALFAVNSTTVNKSPLYSTGGDSATFYQTTPAMPNAGLFQIVVQYGWYYTDGWHWSPFEYTPWYRL